MSTKSSAPWQVVISSLQGGHSSCVQRLLPFNQWFLSADWDGHIKVGT